MRTLRGVRTSETPLAAERIQVLAAIAAIEGSDPTGPAIARMIRPGDQSLLYPALHSLEAEWKLQATWLVDADGTLHRTYRRRRLLPRRPGTVGPR
jgi:hypothetical protein